MSQDARRNKELHASLIAGKVGQLLPSEPQVPAVTSSAPLPLLNSCQS